MLYIAGGSRHLISEAVRGEGAYLIDARGHRFMPEYHPLKELAPRDIVSRAITDQMDKTRHACVYLDLRHLPESKVIERSRTFARSAQSLVSIWPRTRSRFVPGHTT